VFFLSASPETVRRTLQEESLIVPARKKHSSNITRPRFFERSTPNQLWQGDIFTFRLGGRYAYLVGMVDDYSRYMVGLELYRSQTADQVIEVYRRAVGEYGVPKEVLTDRGRQYTNWRGTTRFERELVKDRVKHLKSQAHHPMTLGKIERFWKTIYEEFLVRAQFGSFEEAMERIRQWVR
jgi:transposase InsO family protein